MKGALISNPGDAAIFELRRDLCRISDWGLLKRKREIQEVMATIVYKFEVDRVSVAAEGIDEEEPGGDNRREAEDEEVEFFINERI